MAATLDPSLTAGDLTLSNGNLTVTGPSDTNWRTSSATLAYSTGKYYCEATINAGSGGFGLGLGAAGYSNTTFLGTGSGSLMAYCHGSGNGILQGSYNIPGTSIGTPAFGVGDTIGMAVDFDAQKVWFYNPAADQWNGDILANQNPATGVGGVSTSSISDPAPPGISLLSTGDTLTINMMASSLVHTLPTGFSAWDPSVPGVTLALTGNQGVGALGTAVVAGLAVTLDPATLPGGVTLSNGNLTAATTNFGWHSARGTLAHVSGQYYCEATLVSIVYGVGLGLCNATENLGSVLGGDDNAIMAFTNHSDSSSGVFYGGSIIGAIGTPLFNVGDVIGMAVDLTAQKVWFYNPAAGQWNGDVIGSQNPVGGVGGYTTAAIQSGSAPIFPAVALDVTGDSVTINMGATGFANAPPAGFSAWGASANVTLAVTGNPAGGSLGNLSVSGAPLTRLLTGHAGSGGVGIVTAGLPLTLALSGAAGSGQIGTILANNGTLVSAALTGTLAAGLVGSAATSIQAAALGLRLPLPTLRVSGVAGLLGGVAWPLPLPRLSLLGPDTLTLTLPTPRGAVQGLVGAVGTVALAWPLPRLTVLGPDTLTLTLPTPRLALAGGVGATGGLTLRAPTPRLTLTAQVPYTAQAALTLPSARLVLAGTTGTLGQVARAMSGLALALQGYSGVAGALTLRLPLSTLEIDGYQVTTGQVQLVLPHLQLLATGAQSAQAAASTASNTLVMHTEALSLSTYSNFPFNSFATFNGLVLGAGPDGIFSLGGATDNGAVIQAMARVGMTDFSTSHLKRVDRVYVGYRTDGDLVLRVLTDEIHQRDYLLAASGAPGLHGNHLQIGKGLAARYWQFEVRNLNGADFQLNAIELKPTALARRVGGGDA